MEKVSTDSYASEKREDYTDSWTGLNKLAPELPMKSQQPFPCYRSPAHSPQTATSIDWQNRRDQFRNSMALVNHIPP